MVPGTHRDLGLGEYLFDCSVHLAGWLFAAIALPLLFIHVLGEPGIARIVAVTLYGASLAAMLAFSGLYNMVPRSRAKQVLRLFDHSAIFLLIAGTYSPFALVKLGGAWGIGLFAGLWALAAVGVALTVARPPRVDRINLVLYLMMGWSVLPFLGPLLEAVELRDLTLLLVGGVVFTLGVGFHLAVRLRFQNALWHACVLVAAVCHYAAVWGAMAPAQP